MRFDFDDSRPEETDLVQSAMNRFNMAGEIMEVRAFFVRTRDII